MGVLIAFASTLGVWSATSSFATPAARVATVSADPQEAEVESFVGSEDAPSTVFELTPTVIIVRR